MNSQPTAHRYRALAWLTAAAALAYLCRNAVGVAESTIRTDLRLSLDQSGWFMGAFFWSYALLQVPSGWFVQRVGTRMSLTLFALVWSVATLAIGLAEGFWSLILAQVVMGAAQAGVFPAACHSIGHWMPIASRSAACGVLAAGMQVGAILASGLTGELLVPFGWRLVFLVFALPSLGWSIGFAVRFRNRPDQVQGLNAAEHQLITATVPTDRGEGAPRSGRGSKPTQDAAFSTGPTVTFLTLLCGQQICRAAGYMFFASWFPTFLQETRGVSITTSGYQQAMVLAGTFAGSLCGGIVTDWIYRRTGNLRLSRSGVGTVALSGCSALIFLAYFISNANLAVGVIAAGAFFAALAGPCALAATIDVGGMRVAEVFGLMNMTGNLAAAACPVAVAWLVGRTASWDLVLLTFAGIYLAGAACWLKIQPVPVRS